MIPSGLAVREFALASACVPDYERCPALGVFTTAEKPKTESWHWWGIFIHRFLEYAQTKGRKEALAYIEQKFDRGLSTCRRIDVDRLPRGEVEVALIHNIYDRTTRRTKERANPRRELYGRADLIFRDVKKDNRPHIVDFKCGEPTPDKTPIGNVQLLGLASALRDELDWQDAIDVSIVAVCSSGELVWRTTSVVPDQMHAFAGHGQQVHLKVMQDRADHRDFGYMPPFVKHEPLCEWCDLRPFCPAWRSA